MGFCLLAPGPPDEAETLIGVPFGMPVGTEAALPPGRVLSLITVSLSSSPGLLNMKNPATNANTRTNVRATDQAGMGRFIVISINRLCPD